MGSLDREVADFPDHGGDQRSRDELPLGDEANVVWEGRRQRDGIDVAPVVGGQHRRASERQVL
jgi:hypothetical protein